MEKIVKVKAKITIVENGVVYKPGTVFTTTYKRYKALGKSVELVEEVGKAMSSPKNKAMESKNKK